MRKEEIEIERIKDEITPDLLDELVNYHQDIFNSTFLKNRYICFDENFPAYLKTLINKKDDHIFILKAGKNNICGFVHLKVNDEKIFLNNIYVDDSCRGLGLGVKLLKDSIEWVLSDRIKYFGLDVFKRNNKALEWYSRLGLEEDEIFYWYQLNPKKSNTIDDIVKKEDPNGFLGLFVNEEKVGTVINGNLIVHNLKYLFSINTNQYQTIISKVKSDDNVKNLNPIFLDSSLRMRSDINKVISNL